MGSANLFLTNRNFQDLNPLIAGEEACTGGHSFGPAVRKYTLIHYVLRGKGTLYTRGGVYPVGAGQAFLILPGEVTTYTADATDPWHYRWIGFDGSLSQAFSRLPAVFSWPEDLPYRLPQEESEGGMPEYRLAALLFDLYSRLFSTQTHANHHVRRVENYIRSAYMHPIRVEAIAHQLCLNRRYLSRLFKENTGKSIQEYLICVRLEEAQRYLRQGCTVKEAAHLCGYEDVSNFSKMFKCRFGISPSDFGK